MALESAKKAWMSNAAADSEKNFSRLARPATGLRFVEQGHSIPIGVGCQYYCSKIFLNDLNLKKSICLPLETYASSLMLATNLL
jgi:hypothetical protein